MPRGRTHSVHTSVVSQPESSRRRRARRGARSHLAFRYKRLTPADCWRRPEAATTMIREACCTGAARIIEFGGYTQHVGSRRLYPIQVAQKRRCALGLTMRGPTPSRPAPPRYGVRSSVTEISRESVRRGAHQATSPPPACAHGTRLGNYRTELRSRAPAAGGQQARSRSAVSRRASASRSP